MKRLTEKRDAPLVMSMWPGDSRSLRIYNRLAAIEDILGDDYDLDRLRELVRADIDGRCVVPYAELERGSTMGTPSALGGPEIEAAHSKWMYEMQEEAAAALKARKQDG